MTELLNNLPSNLTNSSSLAAWIMAGLFIVAIALTGIAFFRFSVRNVREDAQEPSWLDDLPPWPLARRSDSDAKGSIGVGGSNLGPLHTVCSHEGEATS